MRITRVAGVLAILSLISSCSWWEWEVVDGVEYHDREIYLLEEDGSTARIVGGPSYGKVDTFQKSIKYVARVLPVDVDGATVQANMVKIAGDLAFIAYNTAGDVFRGAIQIIDISSPSRPKVRDTFRFPECDINSLCVDGAKLLFGAAASPDFSPSGSRTFVGTITIAAPEDETTILAGLKPLNEVPGTSATASYSVTAIARTGDAYSIAIGAADGGIVRLGLDLDTAAGTFASFPDVRDVGGYGGGVFALKGTADDPSHPASGAVLYSLDGAAWNSLPIADFGSPYKKASLDLSTVPNALFGDEDAALFLGLSEAGFQVMSWKSGTLTPEFSAANPAISDPLLLADTNGVTYDSLLAFSANGNYGFRVFAVNPGATPFASIVGYHEMRGTTYRGVQYSANDIAYRQDMLFVATGAGGVNVYSLKNK